MKLKSFIKILSLIFLLSSFNEVEKEYTISNKYILRTISVENVLKTVRIENKLNGEKIIPLNNDEFKLRISSNTKDKSFILTSKDFKVIKTTKYNKDNIMGIAVELKNESNDLLLTVHYELGKNSHYLNKYIEITPKINIILERIDLEIIEVADIYQPYKIKKITTHGENQWKPGLGQPLYTSKSASFLGVEFPASYNYVENNTGYCGYQLGNILKKNQTYKTYKSVIGVGDDSKFIQDAFFEYINQIRIRPLRLHVQYNTWFDYGSSVNKEDFYKSVTIINNELIKKRGIPSFSNYVIDDGWEDVNKDWSDKTWKVNEKFNSDFSYCISNLHKINAQLGLWISPGCLFGAKHIVHKYKEQGFETLDKYMSITGPKYMQLFEDRIIELAKNNVSFFKLDGIFGNHHMREFELNSYKNRIPSMAHFGKHKLTSSSKKLNDSKYDELKTYYLVEGTERLIKIFTKLNSINPNIYIVISNGAYLSPWWLMYIDAVWLINANDASEDHNITKKLVYKDNLYYNIWKIEKTQFPLNSVFNHEPKKITSDESEKEFREYILMCLSRGTGLIDLYLKVDALSEKDWDILADGLKWAHKSFPYFSNPKMHGGNPSKLEVYGYSGWNKNGGYISIHNPSDKIINYQIALDRKIGVHDNKNKYTVLSKLNNQEKTVEKMYSYGDTLSISIQPKQVILLDFLSSKK